MTQLYQVPRKATAIKLYRSKFDDNKFIYCTNVLLIFIRLFQVWYEVKLVENLKWEDYHRGRKDDRRDHGKKDHDKRHDRREKDSDRKDSDKKESEKRDSDKKDEEKKDEDKLEEEVKETNEEKSDVENEAAETEVKEESKKMEADEREDSEKKEDEKEEDKKEPKEEKDKEAINCLRIGWSLLDSSLQLGEAPVSYAYDSDGLKAVNSEFTEYGRKFTAEDVVGTFLVSGDINNSLYSLFFKK